MRMLYFAGLGLWVAFEVANIYFIMPMPFSQRMNSLDMAYLLFSGRWAFRGLALALVVVGARAAFRPASWRRVLPAGALAVAASVAWIANFRMAADQIFLAPASVTMRPAAENVVDGTRLVIGIHVNGDARAYPLQFIGYHHQVRDSAGGQPVLVSYCTVCRSGRVFSPVVEGRVEEFRLVGMDHFNAMFEDRRTRSWWRQVSGDAVAGPLKGNTLPEIPSVQVTLAQWLALHPRSLIMQPDSALSERYPRSAAFETGESRSALTGTDTSSWGEKSWVVGIALNGDAIAVDWNALRQSRVAQATVGGVPVVVVLATDGASYFAFQRPDTATQFTMRGDSLVAGRNAWALDGRGRSGTLAAVYASQEFWHSWRTFNPGTRRYPDPARQAPGA